MPANKHYPLQLNDWIHRHRETADALSCASEDLAAMHRAVDAGLPDRALELAAAAASTCADELDWVRCRAFWEDSRWEEVRTLAARHSGTPELSVLRLRILIRAAWSDLLRAELEGSFFVALEKVRARMTGQLPLAITADLAHLDACRLLVHEGDLIASGGQARLAASLYAHLGEGGAEIKARIFCVRILAIEGRLATAANEAEQAVTVARQRGYPCLLVQALNADATVAFRMGKWEQSLEGYDIALRLAEEFDDRRWRTAVLANRARVLAFRGKLADASQLLDSLGDGVEQQSAGTLAVLEEYRGQVALMSGDPESALRHFGNCLARLERDEVHSYERAEAHLRRAEALLALDQVQSAHAAASEGLALLSEYPRVLERGHLLHVRGLARRAMGRPSEAGEDFARAVEELRNVGDQWTLLRCLLDRYEMDGKGSREQVSDATEALSIARKLDLPDLEDRAAQMLADAQSGLHPARDLETSRTEASGMVVASEKMRNLIAEARTASGSDHPVLIQGETGTGKEVLARYLHEHSLRASGPFVPVNCSAIPDALFEREFFGHVRGAFTGADRDGRGLVEEAHSGTLFLDEVGELPMSLQPKLLRLLQEGTYRRVGETREREVDLRIIAATNRPLRDCVADRSFREDLFYRLSWFELFLSPLRERTADIAELIRTFLDRDRKDDERETWIGPRAWRALHQYPWPGNVRELEAAIGSARVRTGPGHGILLEHLPPSMRSARVPSRLPAPGLDLTRAVRRTERAAILQALRRSEHRRAEAARLLGIGRNTLYEKMKKLGIDPQEPTLRKRA